MNDKLRQLFLKIASHLLTQNEKAKKDDSLDCKYRIEKNGKILKCAAGCLIPDEEYDLEFEGHTILNFETPYNKVTNYFLSKYSNQEIEVIRNLQRLHDDEGVLDWKSRLENLYSGYFSRNLNEDLINEIPNE